MIPPCPMLLSIPIKVYSMASLLSKCVSYSAHMGLRLNKISMSPRIILPSSSIF
ncbi:Uncharacterised protein [Vibrio cholerae]|nr:Uncharacterised protein [Vibrio cholerae]